MHPNPVFHSQAHDKDIAFARARGFGTLLMNGDPVPEVAHIPFLLNETGTEAHLHLVRSNPIARKTKTPRPARLTVTGPDSYISPDWYGVPDQVPTWNYVSVQLTGVLHPCPMDDMRAMLDRQSEGYETRLLPKTPWRTEKMTPDVLERMMRMILPFRFEITDIAATWKLGQNKPDEVRERAADQLESGGLGQDLKTLAALMRTPPEL